MGCCASTKPMSPPQGIGRTERLQRIQPPERRNMDSAENDVYEPSKSTSSNHVNEKIAKEGRNTKREGVLTPDEINQRRISSETITTFRIGSDDNDEGVGSNTNTIQVQFAYCSQRGWYPDDPNKVNQDAVSIQQNFASIEGGLFLAVMDGHGPKGEYFSQEAKRKLPRLLSNYIRQERATRHKMRNETLANNQEDIAPFNPKLWPMLTSEQYEGCCRKAHLNCNAEMLAMQPSVKLSGTTSISIAFHGSKMTISNVGDSRAILGYTESSSSSFSSTTAKNNKLKLKSKPLSKDQTPWRKDERERVMEAGARVMTIDQINGFDKEKKNDFGNRILGEDDDIDVAGDPPRCWLKDKKVPGASFTRSLGDSIAQTIGVNAEPEMYTTEIHPQDKILVLASDGIFEFLPNQTVIDICAKCSNPLEASQKLVDASYDRWLQHEDRTDDITAIVLFFEHDTTISTS